MKPRALIVVSMLALAAVVSLPQTTQAQYGFGAIEGYWTGYWENSNGSSGRDQLTVRESPNGQISGVWGKGYRIFGHQTGPGTYYFEAESEGSLYRARARLVSGGTGLLIDYTVTSWDNSYRGRSQLRRAGPY